MYISMAHISIGGEEDGGEELRVLTKMRFGIVISEALLAR